MLNDTRMLFIGSSLSAIVRMIQFQEAVLAVHTPPGSVSVAFSVFMCVIQSQCAR